MGYISVHVIINSSVRLDGQFTTCSVSSLHVLLLRDPFRALLLLYHDNFVHDVGWSEESALAPVIHFGCASQLLGQQRYAWRAPSSSSAARHKIYILLLSYDVHRSEISLTHMELCGICHSQQLQI